MTAPWILILALAALGLIYVAAPVAGRVFARYRGRRLVTCPETCRPAAVEVSAAGAAVKAVLGAPLPRLKDCSRWPEKEACGQECLAQIEAAPEGCLIRNIVAGWYADKPCAFCGKPIGATHWYDRRPALVSADRVTMQWSQVREEQLPDVLKTHQPVCWNCHIAETFRREHPDLVVERPWKGEGPSAGAGVH